MENLHIAEVLYQVAELLHLKGENPYRIRAYQTAARSVQNLAEPAAELLKRGVLSTVKGIGASTQAKIAEIITTGHLTYLEELRKEIPETLFELLTIPGLGPKRVQTLRMQLGIQSPADLAKACKEGRVAALPGFGEKTQTKLLREIEDLGKTAIRRPREIVIPVAQFFLQTLQSQPGVTAIDIAGSLRRGVPTVKDVDIVVASTDPGPLMEATRQNPFVEHVLVTGTTKTSVRLDSGLQVDVRVVRPEAYVCALAYFTGSKTFNIALRARALDLGYTLNEYVLRPLDGSDPPHFETEEQLHNFLGIDYVPPDQRETGDKVVSRA